MKMKYILPIIGIFLTINCYSQSNDSTIILNRRPIDPMVDSKGFVILNISRFGGFKFFLIPKSEPKLQLSGIPYYVTKVPNESE